MQFSLTAPTSTGGTNALWTYIAGVDDAATFFNNDFQLYIPSSSLGQNFEIDMFNFSTTDNVNYMMRTQWNVGAGVWQVFDAVHGWINTAVTTPPTSGGWTHIQQQAHRVPGDLTHVYYDYIIINGVTHWYSGTVGTPQVQAAATLTIGWSSAVGIQFQIDVGPSGSSGTAVTMNIDEANFVASQASTSMFPYGQPFTGLGWLAKLSGIPQTTKVQAQNITLSLSGIPSSLVAEAVAQVRITGTITLWLGLFDSNGDVIADPVQIFLGALDVPSLTDNGDTSTISITCENPLLSLNLAPQGLFDDADQQIRFFGDLGFSFVEALQNIQLFWPAALNSGSPYPLYMTVTPTSVDIAVGGSTTIEVTIHYSDGSTYTRPAGTGSGPAFLLGVASSDPAIATFAYVSTNNVTGVSPGQCSLMARVPQFGGGSGPTPNQQYRAICSIFVHN